MKKVLILGSCGAGKSTAAIKLSKIVNLPVIHLDVHYWKPGWRRSDEKVWSQKIKELSSQPEWIMEGDYAESLDDRLELADTVIFLYYSPLVTLWSILKRRIKNDRIEKIEGCGNVVSTHAIRWAWTYNKEKAPIIISKISRLVGKDVLVFRNRKRLSNYLNELKSKK